MIVTLAGGVGAARFLQGLQRVYPEEKITVIVNTGDDIELFGLHISPDIDIIMYTLAAIVDETKGWGIKEDSFTCLNMLRKYGVDVWFNIGDLDFATHIARTNMMRNGSSLSEITKVLCKKLGLKANILPMSDDRVETRIITDKGSMHFQEYLVKRGAKDRVMDIVFEGVDKAKPAPGVIDSIKNAEMIILCPSNPLVSIKTILSVNGIEDTLRKTSSNIISITPIIGSSPVKGPLDKMMRELGLEVSAYTVASLYKEFIDAFILDEFDKDLKERIKSLGIRVFLMDTLMKGIKEKTRIARGVLKFAKEL